MTIKCKIFWMRNVFLYLNFYSQKFLSVLFDKIFFWFFFSNWKNSKFHNAYQILDKNLLNSAAYQKWQMLMLIFRNLDICKSIKMSKVRKKHQKSYKKNNTKTQQIVRIFQRKKFKNIWISDSKIVLMKFCKILKIKF